MEKITLVNKFDATIAILEGNEPEIEWTVNDAVMFLQDRAEKAKTKPRKRKENPEVAEFRAALATFMSETEGAVTAAEVAEGMDVSVSKASSNLRYLVGQGIVEAADGEKSRDPKTYTFVG